MTARTRGQARAERAEERRRRSLETPPRPVAEETSIVLDTSDAVTLARRLRAVTPDELARLSGPMLLAGARNLRAAAHSLTLAADTYAHAATLKESS